MNSPYLCRRYKNGLRQQKIKFQATNRFRFLSGVGFILLKTVIVAEIDVFGCFSHQ